MCKPTEIEILETLKRLETGFETSDARLDNGGAAMPAEFISLSAAGAMCDRSISGVQHWLKRERAKPDGFPVRRIRGGVHRADFMAFLETKTNKRTERGQAARAAVDSITE